MATVPSTSRGESGVPADDERSWRAAGYQAMADADLAVDQGDAEAAWVAYLAAAAHYRQAAERAALAGDEGSRRADEQAAVNALYASLPIQPEV